MTRALALVPMLVLAAACAERADEPPHLVFGQGADACEDDQTCVNADTSETTVAGIRVIHKHMPGEPLVSIRLLFDGGAEGWDERTAHAEWMALTLIGWWGGGRHSGSKFSPEIARIGAEFSADSGLDFAPLSITAPVAYFQQAFDLLAECVNEPLIDSLRDDGAVEHVRAVYLQSFESVLDSPELAASSTAWQLIFAGHPYSMRTETLDGAASIGVADVREAYDRLRRRARATLVVAGDVDLASVEQLVKRKLVLSPLDVSLSDLPAVRPSSERSAILDYPDSPGWNVQACFPAPAPGDADYLPLLLGLRALDDLLFDELRTRRALVYTSGTSLADYRVNYGRLWLSTARPAEAMQVFHEVLRSAQSSIDQVVLDGARAQYRTEFLEQNERTSGLTWTLASWQLTTGDREQADTHLQALDEVTPEDAARALATYLPEARYAAAGAGEMVDEAMLVGDQ